MIDFDMIGYTCDTQYCQHPFSDIPGCFEVNPDGVTVGNYAASLVNSASLELLLASTGAVRTYVPELEVVTMESTPP